MGNTIMLTIFDVVCLLWHLFIIGIVYGGVGFLPYTDPIQLFLRMCNF